MNLGLTLHCQTVAAQRSLILAHFESEFVHQFLMGLDTEQFGIVRSNLLATEPLPTMNRAYAAILREERQEILTKGIDSRSMAEASAFT